MSCVVPDSLMYVSFPFQDNSKPTLFKNSVIINMFSVVKRATQFNRRFQLPKRRHPLQCRVACRNTTKWLAALIWTSYWKPGLTSRKFQTLPFWQPNCALNIQVGILCITPQTPLSLLPNSSLSIMGA